MHSNTEARASEPPSQPAITVWLSRHIHLCRLDSTIIVLDLARDQYFGLTGAALQSLAAAVPGWPEPSTLELPKHVPVSSDETSRIIRRFVEDGLLTPHEADGKIATPVELDSSTASIALDRNTARSRGIRFGDVGTFLAACVSTAWSLRWHSLQNAVEAVATRKRSHGGESEFDAERAADLVAIFRRLRSFTFSGQRRCLFHALTLMKFLSRYGVYPKFVMGVKVEPWAAHSWVQCGEYVLDGTPEQVRFYTPILVV